MYNKNEIDISFNNNTITVITLAAIGSFFVYQNRLPQASLVICIALMIANTDNALSAANLKQGSILENTLAPGRPSDIEPVVNTADESIREFVQQTIQPPPVLVNPQPTTTVMDNGLQLTSKSFYDRQFVKTPYQTIRPLISVDISDDAPHQISQNLKQRNTAISSFNNKMYSAPETRQARGLGLVKLLAGAYDDGPDT